MMEHTNFEPWCTHHDVAPSICWYEHNPTAKRPDDYNFDYEKGKFHAKRESEAQRGDGTQAQSSAG